VFGSQTGQSKDIEDHVDELQERFLDIHELARDSLNVVSDYIKARYDFRVNSLGFQKDDNVWLYNPQKKKGKSPKLTPV